MNQLLEVSEIAKLLKCNKNKVYELIKSGQLKALKLGRIKVPTTELDCFLIRNIGKDLSDPYNPKEIGVIEIENHHTGMAIDVRR